MHRQDPDYKTICTIEEIENYIERICDHPIKTVTFSHAGADDVFLCVAHSVSAVLHDRGISAVLFTGLLYERDRNIWGAVMIHFAVGFLPRCFGILQIIEG